MEIVRLFLEQEIFTYKDYTIRVLSVISIILILILKMKILLFRIPNHQETIKIPGFSILVVNMILERCSSGPVDIMT